MHRFVSHIYDSPSSQLSGYPCAKHTRKLHRLAAPYSLCALNVPPGHFLLCMLSPPVPQVPGASLC